MNSRPNPPQADAPAPPPPSEALLSAVGSMRPVTLRSPPRTLLLVTVASTAWAFLVLRPFRVRVDLPWLPQGAFGALLVFWLVAALVALAAALLPPRAQVLASPRRAAWAALLFCVGALAALLALPLDAPGHTLHPADMAEELRHGLSCLGIGASLAALPLAATLWTLRRAAPMGAAALGAAAGAAAGGVAGLGLHVICDVNSRCHLGLAHGGAIFGATILGALVGALVLDRPGRPDRHDPSRAP